MERVPILKIGSTLFVSIQVDLQDDDAGFRQILKGMLTPMTDRLIEAEDGHQALAILAENPDQPVDLVLADMRMPGLDGSALLAQLPVSVPAIIITGADVPAPPRAAALLRKDELTRERLEFTIRGAIRAAGRGPGRRTR
jgi:CheY-like chemotaxis protein